MSEQSSEEKVAGGQQLRAKLRRMSPAQLRELGQVISDHGLGSPAPTTGSSLDQIETPGQTRT